MSHNLVEKFEIVVLLFCLLMLTGCAPRWWRNPPITGTGAEFNGLDDTGGTDETDVGGGQDSINVHMPFEHTYLTRCTQGAGGAFSHNGTSTRFDVDFDTPNDRADLVFAPADGTAYVHDGNPGSGFGIHVNIDLGDGTYLVIGHLSEVFVNNMQDVVAGTIIGYEGTTGSSSGDHVHIGRHDGFADWDAVLGESLEGLAIHANDVTDTSAAGPHLTSDMTCSLSGGHVYESNLATPMWHPNGTLVKTPDDATVYVIEDGAIRDILTEEVFWAQNLNFADVVLVSQSELDCFEQGDDISGTHALWGVFDGTTAWLLIDNNGTRTRFALPAMYWWDILKSWGIEATSYDDLTATEDLGFDLNTFNLASGPAAFRDGTLMRERTNTAVYVVSDGIAMPVVDWHTMLLLGFGTRDIMWVDDGAVASVQGRVGSCAVNAYCITDEDVRICGNSMGEEGVFTDPSDGTDGSTPETEGTETDDFGTETEGVGGPNGTLSLNWTMPAGLVADRITLSGELIESGVSFGWQNFGEVFNASTIDYENVGLATGDTLRFSVEFEDNGGVSWSCLAPFPPGTEQGTTNANYDGIAVIANPADDPESDGCGLLVTIP